MEQLSLLQRFMADTPPFFKKVRALGVLILTAAFMVTQTAPMLIPSKWTLAIGLIGCVLAVLSSFAVKAVAALESGKPITIESAAELFADFAAQINELKNLVINPPKSLAEEKTIIDALPPDPPIPPVQVVVNQNPPPPAPNAEATT